MRRGCADSLSSGARIKVRPVCPHRLTPIIPRGYGIMLP